MRCVYALAFNGSIDGLVESITPLDALGAIARRCEFRLPEFGPSGTDTTPPVITPAQTFTLANNAVNGRVVGTVAATDDVGVTSFTIVGGDPNGVFTIDNTGLVTVADNTTLADGTYTLTVQAGDAAGNATTETVVINVVDPATIGVTPASDCDPGPLALVTLIAPYGTRLELTTNCAPYALAPKATIRGLTPWQVNGTPIGPNVAGERVTQVRATTRLIKVPIIIRGDTETEHEEAVAALGRILNPEIGPNRIAYRRADGTEREITATYVSGADNITLVDMARERHSTAELIFRAHWPFWRQVGTTHGENTATFSNGMFAGSDQVVFNNTGDHTTWPEWTITGPAENITVANMTTGHVWRLRSNLAAGETIRINTDPRDKGIWRNDDLAWVELDPTLSELFSLHPGANILMIRALYPVDGAGGTWDCRWPIWYSTC